LKHETDWSKGGSSRNVEKGDKDSAGGRKKLRYIKATQRQGKAYRKGGWEFFNLLSKGDVHKGGRGLRKTQCMGAKFALGGCWGRGLGGFNRL